LLAVSRPGGPTPLDLARERAKLFESPPGSVTNMLILASQPWSAANHKLFPSRARARARELLLLGLGFSRRPDLDAQAQALFDVWVHHVMPLAIDRNSRALGVVGLNTVPGGGCPGGEGGHHAAEVRSDDGGARPANGGAGRGIQPSSGPTDGLWRMVQSVNETGQLISLLKWPTAWAFVAIVCTIVWPR